MLLASVDQSPLVGVEGGRAVGCCVGVALPELGDPNWHEANKLDSVPAPQSVRNSLRFISADDTIFPYPSYYLIIQ
jgi:hypothetical protein